MIRTYKCLIIFLALVLALGGLPPAAFAQAALEAGVCESSVEVAAKDSGSMGENDSTLVNSYVQQRIDSSIPKAKDSLQDKDEPILIAQSAGDALQGNDKVLYDALKRMIAEVAAGDRTSTVFEVPLSSLGYDGPWTAEQLGVGSLFDGSHISQEAQDAALARVACNVGKVTAALAADFPFELYWFDKTCGYSYMSFNSYSISWSNDSYMLSLEGPFRISYMVSSDYSATGAERTTQMKPGVMQPVTNALAKASKIVSQNKGKSVYDRLAAYKEAICKEVAYNYEAAKNSNTQYDDPWQLIWVFDGDEATDVVCEGYSKAFKYLCDLTWGSSASKDKKPLVECLLVSGMMITESQGAHMWNILRMDNDQNYLVDITNCDTDSIGYPSELFMAYTATGSVEEGYAFVANEETITYTYNEDTLSAFDKDALTISASAYEPPVVVLSLDDANVEIEGDFEYDGTHHMPYPVVTLDGNVITKGYTVTYLNNREAGTATVTVEGTGEYTGKASCEFAIAPRPVTISWADLEYTYDGTTKFPTLILGNVLDGDDVQATTSGASIEAGTHTATVTDLSNPNYRLPKDASTQYVIAEAKEPDLSKDGWVTLTDGSRAFVKDGALRQGWVTVGEDSYFFNEEGKAAVGWKIIDGTEYYFREDNRMATGWATIDGVKYIFRQDGRRVNGWTTWSNEEGTYSYYADEGVPRSGWQTIDGSRYYFREDGTYRMASGWATIEGKNVLFYYDGSLARGWVSWQDGTTFYKYYADEGVPRNGWQELAGASYYFREDGRMASGWATIDGQSNLFRKDGRVAQGWMTWTDGNNTYSYYADEGTPCIGWQTVDGREYYFREDGRMATDWATIEGQKVQFSPLGSKVA